MSFKTRPAGSRPKRGKRFLGSVAEYLPPSVVEMCHILKNAVEDPAAAPAAVKSWFYSNIVTSSFILFTTWVLVLNWGEAGTFSQSITSCDWNLWEDWVGFHGLQDRDVQLTDLQPAQATPHRLVLVADPQLIDPHTYPDRPWPLSTLTIKHTDLYLSRTFSRIQRTLRPHTTVFLGDLFDGGREWSTHGTVSPEDRWRRYGENFWLQEYTRFSNIFLRDWRSGEADHNGVGPRHQIIASLPGNHDLGFGQGIQKGTRDRFQAFFGDGNRIDIIGNHTFVSVDGVSLSAKDQESLTSTAEIWGPTEAFLEGVQRQKIESIQRHLNHTQDFPISSRHLHVAQDVAEAGLSPRRSPGKKPASHVDVDFPTVLLTHVPLFRAAGTPCGPSRERWPPSPPPQGQAEPVVPDERNAIPMSAGYQYQNTLTRVTSRYIIEKLGGNVEYAFSGDDHDYCDVVHHQLASKGSGVREITVKSMSWAMGVRHPGFLLVSMWNPVDEQGKSVRKAKSEDPAIPRGTTLQTRLCLLPDQLSIFIYYVILAAVSVGFLLTRSILVVFIPAKFDRSFLRPRDHTLLSSKPSHARTASGAELEKSGVSFHLRTSTDAERGEETTSMFLSARDAVSARTRVIPGKAANSHNHDLDEMSLAHDDSPPSRANSQNKYSAMLLLFLKSIWGIAWKVLLYYALLLRG